MKTREIAARIATEAAKYPTEIAYVAGTPDAEFRFGTLRIRCPAYQEAVLKVARKYELGLCFYTTHKKRKGAFPLPAHTLRRPPDADALLAALLAECGEVQP
jgi:hypothetical protein